MEKMHKLGSIKTDKADCAFRGWELNLFESVFHGA
eukprot:CAMPEP_0194054958 /NCGR_PEP_ID=MMETSP0009_2-20130614/55127_1 /TAXON_ID=210454 /ORGANISM="Grammatophora oceanica, Strain CCMP 410" /LENGTH=34 /DNA_ID= /DNA_START= /DNA_END= /DNA_ORIENTATION=